MEFFRHCPGCGRRFHIKLESKKSVHMDRDILQDQPRTSVSQFRAGSPLILFYGENRPITVDVESFQYTYKCNHCGHEWTENRVSEYRERDTGPEQGSVTDVAREEREAKEERYARE